MGRGQLCFTWHAQGFGAWEALQHLAELRWPAIVPNFRRGIAIIDQARHTLLDAIQGALCSACIGVH